MCAATADLRLADLAAVDVSDLDHWNDGPPHELFARLRREAPVHWSPLAGFPGEAGFWSITRWEDIAQISRDWETFSSERGGIFVLNDMGLPLEVQTQQMISMDPPRHDRMKALVQRAFTPRRVQDHAARIRDIVAETLDAIAPRGEADIVAEVATIVPTKVIGDLLGVPREDCHLLAEWTNLILGFEDPNLRPRFEDGMRALTESSAYVAEMAAARRAQPTDDLMSALVHAEVDGDRLTDIELTTFFLLLMVGGNDSTRATYSGAVRSLIEHPDQRRWLVDDPSRIPHAVEEVLRYYPAFNYFRRTATRDVELHGQTIHAGDKVVLWYVSSCRDASVVPDAQAFEVRRDKVDHQAFGGGGRHFCLGSGLARLELKILLEETLARFGEMAFNGTPTRARSTIVSQHLTLPVRWGGAS